ncbi:glycosyltransferase [Sulfitobacter sp. R18_2]|uniref:glycosyltransferase n=1 Tax=Sulfitobacter sp. R18_2 TaxID=2821105 RepID=UPI001ADAC5F6|nr:glycosyltransferase [Sulfitobacter sp. R18_2]MBO9440127.1 glycosyltransferase [Sulfitobacter sp. R18_2]
MSPDLAKAWEEKLWAGFSRQALRALSDIEADFEHRSINRLHAAYALMRWHLTNRNNDAALSAARHIDVIGVPRNYEPQFNQMKMECLLAAGRQTEAATLAQHLTSAAGKNNNNYRCAVSNQIFGMQSSSSEYDLARLEEINKMFVHAGFERIRLLDRTHPLKISNLAGIVDYADRKAEGPCVSVLMPTYNASEFIVYSINSIRRQSWRNIEIIVVDDCSTDNTADIIEKLAAEDTRIKLIKLDANGGAYNARNTALEAATGEFITVHDADDWSHPQMLETQLRPLLDNPDMVATMSQLCRTTDELIFQLRPYRPRLDYIHWNYSSLMFRRRVVEKIGSWDRVAAGADSEFIERMRMVSGNDAIKQLHPNVPLSFALVHPASLTQNGETSLRSFSYGGRREYFEQSQFWHKNADITAGPLARVDAFSPFLVPNAALKGPQRHNDDFDVVLVSDLSLPGGTRRCNLAYLRNLREMGARVSMFHLPRLTSGKLRPIDDEYRSLAQKMKIRILTHEDEVKTILTLLHYPPAFQEMPDMLPRIHTKHVRCVVNQLGQALYSGGEIVYSSGQVATNIQEWLGIMPIWVPISNLTRTIMHQSGFDNIQEQSWLPPLDDNYWFQRPIQWRGETRDRPVIGRHGRDHWTKWPAEAEDIRSIYFVGTDTPVHIMGGDRAPNNILGAIPENWTSLPFDSVSVYDFIDEIDIYINFINHDYIEEFGRNIMEAMAMGIPAILDESFRSTFGDAATYCRADEVRDVVEEIWDDKAHYLELAERGRVFVHANCGPLSVKNRFRPLITPNTTATEGGFVS